MSFSVHNNQVVYTADRGDMIEFDLSMLSRSVDVIDYPELSASSVNYIVEEATRRSLMVTVSDDGEFFSVSIARESQRMVPSEAPPETSSDDR